MVTWFGTKLLTKKEGNRTIVLPIKPQIIEQIDEHFLVRVFDNFAVQAQAIRGGSSYGALDELVYVMINDIQASSNINR